MSFKAFRYAYSSVIYGAMACQTASALTVIGSYMHVRGSQLAARNPCLINKLVAPSS